jgi:hypothetical protein
MIEQIKTHIDKFFNNKKIELEYQSDSKSSKFNKIVVENI